MAANALWTACNVCAWCGWTYALVLVVAGGVPREARLPEVVLACELRRACVWNPVEVAPSRRAPRRRGSLDARRRVLVDGER